MNLLGTDLVEILWKVIIVIAFIAAWVGLIRSAAASLKVSHKVRSVLDEVGIGILTIFAFIIIVQIPIATIFDFIKTPFIAVWNLFINFLRQVGLPI